ncbi:BPL-N domain-containing protein [Streptomyces mayteni]
MTAGPGRRRVLAALATLAAPPLLSGCATPRRPPSALVYRGPAASPGCPEAVAALLRGTPSRFTVTYCGPDEETPLSARALAAADVYAQPGGGDDVDAAWAELRPFADDLRDWVRGGGRYLGFCMGGYLAGRDPGLGLLPGDSGGYIDSPGASVTTGEDTVIRLRWRGRPRHVYFQDGPYFQLADDASATVLATYDNGLPAAVVARSGAGRVGVVGPHPEADASWYADHGLTNPDGIGFDLGHDLVETLAA